MFEYYVPTRVVFGQGYINRVGEIIKEYGDKVLLVGDPQTMQETSFYGQLKQLISQETHGVLVYDKIDANADSETVNRGVDQARYSRSNVIVGFGRKTALNVAKAIAYVVSHGGAIEDYFFSPKVSRAHKVAYIEIPTSHGFVPGLTNSFWVMDRFDKIKKQISSPGNFADVVVMDPKLSMTLHPQHIATIGVEVLAMAIEAYISKASTPISDAMAVKAIEYLGANLVKSLQDPENINYRTSLSTAGVLTSLSTANSSPGGAYALALALNSVMNVSLGHAMTILLPHIMEFNLTSAPNRYVHIARAFGEVTQDITVVEAAIKAIESVRKILFDLKVPHRLSDLKVDKDRFFEVAHVARNFDFLHYLPRPVTKEDFVNLLSTAL